MTQKDEKPSEINPKNHILWIDIVKGLTIIVVVFLHINYVFPVQDNYHLKGILGDDWDMPIFFLIGGFFISQQKVVNTASFIKHKFKTLYLKLLYYYIFFLCIHNLLIRFGFLSTNIEYGGKYMETFTIVSFLKSVLLSLLFMGREPYLSPLWFVYVMFLAFIIISLISWIVNRITRGNSKRWLIITTLCLAILCSISLFSTNTYDFTIPRCNNTFSAAWLIFAGFLLYNKLNITFNNTYIAIISLVVFLGITFPYEHMALMTNSYHDIVQMTLCGVSALYILSYFAIHIEKSSFGKILAYIGNNSFHIMALHLLCFNLIALLLNSASLSSMPINILGTKADNWIELVVLTIFGVMMPIGIINIIRHIKEKLLCIRK